MKMKMYDFECPKCSLEFEELVTNNDRQADCPKCGTKSDIVFSQSPTTLTNIIPSYPGCLKQKAGYVHSHGDRPATKLQSGYGGCQKPS